MINVLPRKWGLLLLGVRTKKCKELILAMGARHDRESNPGTHNYEPSTLPYTELSHYLTAPPHPHAMVHSSYYVLVEEAMTSIVMIMTIQLRR